MITVNRPILWVVLSLGGPLLAACTGSGTGEDKADEGVDDTDDPTDTPADTDVDTTQASENPPLCDDTCTSVTNAGGSTTTTLNLVAKGGTRTYTVDGEEVTVHVSTYDDLLPGPTVEITASASNPEHPTNSDILVLNVRNEGKLNTCCWHLCPTVGAETCWEPYCRGTGLRNGDACIQIDTETNIHTHGLHIAAATAEQGPADACMLTNADAADPVLPWDNVFIAIPASGEAEQMSCADGHDCTIGNEQAFMFPIGPRAETSPFQPNPVVYPQWFGLQWYHPHMHEVSQDQLNRGMAGALIVRSPDEERIPVLAAIPRTSERVIVLQRVPIDSSEIIQSSFVRLINGKVRPRFTIRAGETQRWRMVNAGANAPVHLSVDHTSGALPLYPIGFDGVPTSTIRPALGSYWLAAGSRFEALITAPADASVGDSYNVTWCETDVANGSGEPTDSLAPDAACTGTTIVGATLEIVEGSTTPVSFSAGDPFANLADFGLVPDLWAESEVTKRTIRFTQVVDPLVSAQFYLDVGDGNGDQQFSMHQVCEAPVASTLGAVEEWTIENWTTDIHTIHIHVNPFQVDPESLDASLGSAPMYQDNALLPIGVVSTNPLDMGAVKTPGVLKLRIKNTDYVGTSVFHCHVLDHEDHGMMAAIHISAD